MRLINSLFASILFVVLSISYVLADTKSLINLRNQHLLIIKWQLNSRRQ